MLFFLPPSLRIRYGPLIRIAEGLVLGVIGIFVMTRVFFATGGLLIVWGIVALVGRSRRRGDVFIERQDVRGR